MAAPAFPERVEFPARPKEPVSIEVPRLVTAYKARTAARMSKARSAIPSPADSAPLDDPAVRPPAPAEPAGGCVRVRCRIDPGREPSSALLVRPRAMAFVGAGDGIRTRDPDLGKVVLYP